MSWRKRPAAIDIEDADAVLQYLQDNMLNEFIRTRETIDRQSMLKHPDRAREVPGVRIIDEREDFVVKTSTARDA